jgi:hypothetical protein
MNPTAEEITGEILYMPVTIGKLNESIESGVKLIESYANQQNKWVNAEDRLPDHKDLVLIDVEGFSLPAIYYSYPNFKGFYKFTLHFHCNSSKYNKVYLKDKHKFRDVKRWLPLPKPPKV